MTDRVPLRAPVAVLGVGNVMRRDDGVGAAVLAALDADAATREAEVDLIELDGEPARLLEAWSGRQLAIVVDAALAGAEPGTVHEMHQMHEIGVHEVGVHEVAVGRDPLPDWSRVGGTHAAGVAEAVALARTLDRLPERLVVLGVEAADLGHGPGLSPAVAEALPTVIERIRQLMARFGARYRIEP